MGHRSTADPYGEYHIFWTVLPYILSGMALLVACACVTGLIYLRS